MIDYLRTISVEDISGRGDRRFSTSILWGYPIAGELTVRLSTIHHVRLSHVVVAGFSMPDGSRSSPSENPTALWINEESGQVSKFSDSAAYAIHRAIGARIQDQREETEQRLGILNAEILRGDTQPQWVRHKSKDEQQVFTANVGNIRLLLSHSNASFFGFKRERYELVGRYSCELFDAESRYSDDRARILFHKVVE